MIFKKDISFVMFKWLMKLWRSLSADLSLPNFVQKEDFNKSFSEDLLNDLQFDLNDWIFLVSEVLMNEMFSLDLWTAKN